MMSIEKGGNTLNWASANLGQRDEPAEKTEYGVGILKDPEAALDILDQTIAGEIDSYPEGEGKYNQVVRKTQEKMGEAQTANLAMGFPEEYSGEGTIDVDDDNVLEWIPSAPGINHYDGDQRTSKVLFVYKNQTDLPEEEGEEGIQYKTEEATYTIDPSKKRYETMAPAE
jgi:hypothetical protein